MSISLPRKIMLLVVETGMCILWFFDRFAGFNFGSSLRVIKKVSVSFISFIFIIFLGYSFFTGYLSKVFEGFLSSNLFYVHVAEKDYPVLVRSLNYPTITARSVLVIEKSKGKVLFEKNSRDVLPPASTVKLMTALVALDLYNLEDELVVSKPCTSVEGTKGWFPENSKLKVKDLINGMLISSFGDFACILATSKVSELEFVDLMNEKAKEIGMSSTVFSNPIGLDNINGGHYSTTFDLYKLAVYSTSTPEIYEAVGKRISPIASVDNAFTANLINTNKLLWEIPESTGIKTGTTESAGEVLIYEYKDDLRDIIIIVMGSKDRFGDTKKILSWVLDSYSWQNQN